MDNLYFFIPKSKLNHYGLTIDASENEVAQAISGEEGPLYGDDLIPNFDYIEKEGYNYPTFEPGDDFGIAVTWEITAGMCTDIYAGSFKEFQPYVEKLNEVLMRAAESGNIEDAKIALENGAEADNRIQNAGWTPLQRAASYGHFEMVKFLEENGANSHEGYDFAFRRAITNGHLDIAEYLYEKGADIHHGNEEALHTALSSGRKDLVEFLIDRGADTSDMYDHLIYLAKANHVKKASLGALADISPVKEKIESFKTGHNELFAQLNEMIESEEIDLSQSIDDIVEAYKTAYHHEIADSSTGDTECEANLLHDTIGTAIAIMRLEDKSHLDQTCDFATMLQRATSEDLGMGFITPEKAEELYKYASQYKSDHDLESATKAVSKNSNTNLKM